MRVPLNWKVKNVNLMADVLGGSRDLAKLQARADMHHICENFKTFNTVQRAVRQYTKYHKPLSYILGSQPFLNVDLKVKRPILIPRPETEFWVKWLIDNYCLDGKRILDVGCGSGCIGLSIAKAFPQSQVVGIDISRMAIELAEENAKRNNIYNIQFTTADICSYNPDTKFDIIVSNPPYIPCTRRHRLPKSVRCHEDGRALFSGPDGMSLITQLVHRAPSLVNNNYDWRLLFEFDAPNCEKVMNILSFGRLKYDLLRDQFDKPRLAIVSTTSPSSQ